MRKVLSQIVRSRRLALGLSIAELAKQAKVSSSYLYAIESGTRGNRLVELARIATALQTSFDELAGNALGTKREQKRG